MFSILQSQKLCEAMGAMAIGMNEYQDYIMHRGLAIIMAWRTGATVMKLGRAVDPSEAVGRSIGYPALHILDNNNMSYFLANLLDFTGRIP